MSKLYNSYLVLKKQDNDTIYLFKTGLFFICLDQDAIKLSNTLNLKLIQLNKDIVKCGFPCSSFEKYNNLFKLHNLNIKIIEDNNLFNLHDYSQNKEFLQLVNFINSVNVNELSVKEAYNFIADLQNKTKNIIL